VRDRLWVRESFYTLTKDTTVVYYKADYYLEDRFLPLSDKPKYRPPLFMPRWASRITLEITGLRVERLQEISDRDCDTEGVRPSVDGNAHDWRGNENGWHRTFRQLWDSLNAKRGYGWDTNPWVWVIEFKALEA